MAQGTVEKTIEVVILYEYDDYGRVTKETKTVKENIVNNS